MSHLSRATTELKKPEFLLKSIESNRTNYIEVNSKKNDILVPQSNNSPIFLYKKSKNYDLVNDISFWVQSIPNDLFVKRLKKFYAQSAIIASNSMFEVQLMKSEINKVEFVIERYQTTNYL